MRVADSANCPACGFVDESAKQFICDCPASGLKLKTLGWFQCKQDDVGQAEPRKLLDFIWLSIYSFWCFTLVLSHHVFTRLAPVLVALISLLGDRKRTSSADMLRSWTEGFSTRVAGSTGINVPVSPAPVDQVFVVVVTIFIFRSYANGEKYLVRPKRAPAVYRLLISFFSLKRCYVMCVFHFLFYVFFFPHINEYT